MKIQTPLGTIEIYIDGVALNYSSVELAPDARWAVDGRFCIRVPKPNDGQPHTVSCRLNALCDFEINLSTGECLEIAEITHRAVQVNVGIALNEGIEEPCLDYSSELLGDGIAYVISPETQTKVFVFGVAWINDRTAENENNVWFSCDPTMM